MRVYCIRPRVCIYSVCLFSCTIFHSGQIQANGFYSNHFMFPTVHRIIDFLIVISININNNNNKKCKSINQQRLVIILATQYPECLCFVIFKHTLTRHSTFLLITTELVESNYCQVFLTSRHLLTQLIPKKRMTEHSKSITLN